MKKLTLLAIAFVAISFASCKKDRTCTCTDTTTSGSTSTTSTSTVKILKASKKNAMSNCLSYETTGTSSGTTYTVKGDCKLS